MLLRSSEEPRRIPPGAEQSSPHRGEARSRPDRLPASTLPERRHSAEHDIVGVLNFP